MPSRRHPYPINSGCGRRHPADNPALFHADCDRRHPADTPPHPTRLWPMPPRRPCTHPWLHPHHHSPDHPQRGPRHLVSPRCSRHPIPRGRCQLHPADTPTLLTIPRDCGRRHLADNPALFHADCDRRHPADTPPCPTRLWPMPPRRPCTDGQLQRTLFTLTPPVLTSSTPP